MTRTTCFLGLVWCVAAGSIDAADGLLLARGGQTAYVISVAAAPSAQDMAAATELQSHLAQVAGVNLRIASIADVPADAPQIIVGDSPRAAELLPQVNVDALGPDGIVIKAVGEQLVLRGKPPRGTLYAVYTFLEDVVGCRWWTATESFAPRRPELIVPTTLDVTYAPALRYREAFYRDAADGLFAARLKCNGAHHAISNAYGGHYRFAGFVHTFYPLIPPQTYFAAHPEWFSEVKGKRISEHGQLCLVNSEVRQELIRNALALLRKTPGAGYLSVSQNDWDGHCQCAGCAAIEREEESPAGPLLRFVNAVAEAVEKEFPDVLVETLAYQYTRKPPKITRPRSNVVVRLCSIECSFLQPLSAPQNAAFRRDIEGWSRIAPQLFIWDYVTNFSAYMLPHPNLRVLAPNIRFFVDHKTIGLFEQGDFGCRVGDFVRLRAWLLAHLMWNPQADPGKLIDEFLGGYYGAAGPHLRAYLDLLHDRAEQTGVYLRCFQEDTAAWLDLPTLNKATELYARAEQAVAGDPTLAARVRRERLTLDYAWLQRYDALRRFARVQGLEFRGPADRAAAVAEFIRLAHAHKVGEYRETQPFVRLEERLQQSLAPPAEPPEICRGLNDDQWIDIQDRDFRLAKAGTWVELVSDRLASDRKAARMPGDHFDWAISYPISDDIRDDGQWRGYVAVRCEASAKTGAALTMGLYDAQAKRGITQRTVKIEEVTNKEYRLIDLGEFPLKRGAYFWVAPPKRPGEVLAVYVDRIVLVRSAAKH